MARKFIKRQSTLDAQVRTDGCTALYIRVSTEKQATEGNSLAAQEKRLRSYCDAQGWQVCEEHIYSDAVSGKTADRPDFQRMLTAVAEKKISRVVAVKLDRVARSTKDFLQTVETLHANGCSMALIQESFDTSSPHGKFAITMFAAMAELEASMISERVSSGRKQKASTGGYNGARIPLGYNYSNGVFTIDSGAAGAVKEVFARFVAGENMSAIADHLNNTGVQTSTGGKWYAATVKYILRNGFYAGLAQWDGAESAGKQPAIISRELYEAAHSRLQSIKPGKQL